MPEEELLLKANQWEISHGGLTGRAAQQFIDYIVGTEEEKKEIVYLCIGGKDEKLWR